MHNQPIPQCGTENNPEYSGEQPKSRNTSVSQPSPNDTPAFIRKYDSIITLLREIKYVIQKIITVNESSTIHYQHIPATVSESIPKRSISYEFVSNTPQRKPASSPSKYGQNTVLSLPRSPYKTDIPNTIPSDVMKRSFKNPNFYSSASSRIQTDNDLLIHRTPMPPAPRTDTKSTPEKITSSSDFVKDNRSGFSPEQSAVKNPLKSKDSSPHQSYVTPYSL